MKVYVLLPAFNEEASIKNLLNKIDKILRSAFYNYEIIVCDDGSLDRTSEILMSQSKKLPITVVTHSINRGLGETSRDNFEMASKLSENGDVIVRLDCDDTHEPKFILKMIKKIEEGYDVVIASRFEKGGGQEGVSKYRAFISYGANIFMKLFFPIKGVKDYSSGYRAYSSNIIKKSIRIYGNSFIQLKGFGFTCTLEKLVKLHMLRAKITEIPFTLRYDQKKSKSKMIGSLTMLGYIVMVILYYWPFGGWKKQMRSNSFDLKRSIMKFGS